MTMKRISLYAFVRRHWHYFMALFLRLCPIWNSDCYEPIFQKVFDTFIREHAYLSHFLSSILMQILINFNFLSSQHWILAQWVNNIKRKTTYLQSNAFYINIDQLAAYHKNKCNRNARKANPPLFAYVYIKYVYITVICCVYSIFLFYFIIHLLFHSILFFCGC